MNDDNLIPHQSNSALVYSQIERKASGLAWLRHLQRGNMISYRSGNMWEITSE